MVNKEVVERIGKYFEFGYPHFNRGIEYNWPNQDINFGDQITSKKEELGEFLLEQTRKYMDDFFNKKHRSYPYLQTGMNGLALHIGDGGRWIEVWKMMGASFIGGHNLDSYIERAVAFNVGSDTIEFLDPTILTPRVSKQGENYTISYPLPHGMNVIPNHEDYNSQSIERLLQLVGLKTELTFNREENKQEISTLEGKITLEGGICELKDFKAWDLPKATWVASHLMSLCKLD